MVIVVKVFGKFKSLVFVFGQVFQFRQPVAVGCFVVNEQAERLVLVSLRLQPVDTHICDDICQITFLLYGIVVHGDEVRIVIVSLSW